MASGHSDGKSCNQRGGYRRRLDRLHDAEGQDRVSAIRHHYHRLLHPVRRLDDRGRPEGPGSTDSHRCTTNRSYASKSASGATRSPRGGRGRSLRRRRIAALNAKHTAYPAEKKRARHASDLTTTEHFDAPTPRAPRLVSRLMTGVTTALAATDKVQKRIVDNSPMLHFQRHQGTAP